MRSDTPGRDRIVLALEADLPVRDAAHAAADVVFVVRGERDGHVAASGTDSMPLPAAATAGSATGSSKFHVQFELPPGGYLMRTVVREPGGLVGSADRRLEVRAFSGPDVSISDLVLGSTAGALPVRAEAYAATGLSGVLEAYGRTSDQLGHLSIRASVVSHGSETPVATALAELTPPEPSGGGFLQRATFSMPLTNVAPGAYVVKVNVRSGNEPLADLEREVDVFAGSAPAVITNASVTTPHARDILNGDFVKRAADELRRSTDPSAVHATKGFDLFAREEYSAAAAELSAALKLDPTSAPTAFVLGWAYENSGDNRQAIGAWRAAAAIDPKMVPAHLALADAYLKIAQPALAAQALRAGLAALPDSVELHAKLEQIERRQ